MTPKQTAWKYFSLYIRKRTDYCEFHTRLRVQCWQPPCRGAGVLQCCHKVSRSKTSILFDERNVFSGCSGSNTWAYFHQMEWDRFWRALWPNDEKHLDLVKDIIVHRKAKDYLAIAEYYKRKLKELT